jgi:hypothetical protein
MSDGDDDDNDDGEIDETTDEDGHTYSDTWTKEDQENSEILERQSDYDEDGTPIGDGDGR